VQTCSRRVHLRDISSIVTKRYITDQLHEFYRISLGYKKSLHEEQTEFQKIQVVQTEYFGNVLLLDGIIQLTEFDNAAYHEMMAHVPLMAHKHAKKVLIVGGGDGGALQQVLLHPNVEQVTVVELDRRVVEVCKKYFPKFGDPFSDPRVNLVVEDAFHYLGGKSKQFDVALVDSTDPIGEAGKLFTGEFYELLVGALGRQGVAVTQCEQMYFDAPLIREMLDTAKGLVKEPAYYYALVPTYPGGGIGFLYMSDVPWKNGLGKKYPATANYINAEVHAGAFGLPEFLKKQLGA